MEKANGHTTKKPKKMQKDKILGKKGKEAKGKGKKKHTNYF